MSDTPTKPPESTEIDPRGRQFGEQQGEMIGPYKLLSVIGQGGFGTVWLAERRGAMVQRVALKIIKPGMDSAAVIARFEQERQALAVMDHPNVARVFDAGTTPAGRPYFVMEHVKGEAITAFCDRHRLTVRQRLELFIGVCDAVQHAHMKGIIHRDIKPSNILVTFVGGAADGEDAVDVEAAAGSLRSTLVKVIDFGIAKAISQSLTDKTIFTMQGMIIGTPEYMSPEQAELGAVDIDTRSDVYSLGVTLYELLVGVLPFDAARLRAMAYGEVQRLIRETDPPKPSTRLESLRRDRKPGTDGDGWLIADRRQAGEGELVRLLRRELNWVPMKAMRKDRRQRYQSAGAMGADIQRYLTGQALHAGPESAWYKFQKFAHRNGPALAVAATLLLLLTGFGIASSAMYFRTARAERGEREGRQAAQLAATEKERQAYAANIAAAGADVELGRVAEAQRRLSLCPDALRGWEWRHLKWEADWSKASVGLDAPLVGVHFSPSPGVVVMATSNSVELWDQSLKRRTMRWGLAEAGAKGKLEIVTASADGSVAVATDRDEGGRTQLYLLSSGREPIPIKTESSVELAMRAGVSNNGRRAWVTSVHEPGHSAGISVFDTSNGREVAWLAGELNAAWYADGARVACITDGALHRYDLTAEGPPEVVRWPEGSGYPSDMSGVELAVREDGSAGIVTSSTGVWVFDLAKTPTVERLAGVRSARLPVITPDGATAAWLVDAALEVYFAKSGRTAWLHTAASNLLSLAIDDTGERLLASIMPTQARMWDLADMYPVDPVAEAGSEVRGVSVSPRGDAAIIVMSAAEGEATETLVHFDQSTPSAARPTDDDVTAIADGGSVVARVSSRGQIEFSRGEVTQMVNAVGLARQRLSLAIKPPVVAQFVGEDLVVVAADDQGRQDVIAFGAGDRSPRLLGWLTTKSDPCMAVSGSGMLAVGAGSDVKVWTGTSGTDPVTVQVQHLVSSLAFDVDGRCLGVGGTFGEVMLVSNLTEPRMIVMEGSHQGKVNSLAFVPGTRRLLTGSTDRTVVVWDLDTRDLMVSLTLDAPVLHVGFPAGGENGVAILQNGVVRALGVRQ